MAWTEPGGTVHLIALDGTGTAAAIPMAVFYNSADLNTHFGREAVALHLGAICLAG